ncbi:hypothetical protein [Chryseobacterium sp.]|uniref:hypothetical protein n=1 Tax=Chryseobacterium sp. TaxID=1871047 RepID=UPI0025BA7986|nr:hypothetical protein [Chryseobacterium sp.]MBV8327344.1 hypothetical protein [Chryseobacterium sp.]
MIWLLVTAFDFDNSDQLSAVSGILGVSLHLTPWKNKFYVTILSFIMMLLPVAGRMIKIPIEQFNYPAFEIPLFIFFVCYLIFIILNAKKAKPVVSL